MALPDKTVYIAEVDKIVASLKIMWASVDTNNSNHPLRNILRQMDAETNIESLVTDTDYIDAAYLGQFPNKGADINSKVFSNLLAFTTATVENAAPADVVLTFAENITDAVGVSLGGEVKIISTITVGAVVTITVTFPYANGDGISVNGNFRGVSGAVAILTSQVVTNNVA